MRSLNLKRSFQVFKCGKEIQVLESLEGHATIKIVVILWNTIPENTKYLNNSLLDRLMVFKLLSCR